MANVYTLPDGAEKKIVERDDGMYGASVTYKGTTTSMGGPFITASDADKAIGQWCFNQKTNQLLPWVARREE